MGGLNFDFPLLLSQARFQVFVHFRSQNVLPAGVALLQNLSFFGLRYNGLFHSFGLSYCVLLDPGQKFSIVDVLVFSVEADGLDKFEVIPVDVALFGLLAHSFLLSSALLLLQVVVLEAFLASLEDLLLV